LLKYERFVSWVFGIEKRYEEVWEGGRRYKFWEEAG
jgi:hypothetical protein